MNDFNAIKVKDDIVEWIRSYFKNQEGSKKAVIGISGGKDSAITAALCKEAIGVENVITVQLPYGQQVDIQDSTKVIQTLEIPSSNRFLVNIKPMVESTRSLYMDNIDNVLTFNAGALMSMKARMRMCALYGISQTVDGRVANTCNLSEDYVGYFTRFGDGAGDFSPLGSLTVTEVKQIGKAVGLPSDIVEKTPSDGLCGKSDETALGFTYANLDIYIRTGDYSKLGKENMLRVEEMHKKAAYKFNSAPAFIL